MPTIEPSRNRTKETTEDKTENYVNATPNTQNFLEPKKSCTQINLNFMLLSWWTIEGRTHPGCTSGRNKRLVTSPKHPDRHRGNTRGYRNYFSWWEFPLVRYKTYLLHPLLSPILSKFLRTSYIIYTLQQPLEPRSVILMMKATCSSSEMSGETHYHLECTKPKIIICLTYSL